MIKKHIAIITLCALLSACSDDEKPEPRSTQKVMDIHGRICRNHGHKQDSPAFQMCMMRLYETYAHEKDLEEKAWAAQEAAKKAAEEAENAK